MYHRDAEDFRFLKLFLYLTDVRAENGAHVYIRGSHLAEALTQRGPIADTDAERAFAEGDRLVMIGPAGSGFLENTWGVHRALPATQGERLLFSITYSLSRFNPQSPARTVGKNTFGVDPYINRVYLA